MTEFVFRETYTLTDAIELLGHHLFAHTWTGEEHFQQKVVVPDELAKLRTPLEEKLSDFSAALIRIDEKIARSLNAGEISSLKKDRSEIQRQWDRFNWQLNRLPLLNEFTRANHESLKRYESAKTVLVGAIRDRHLSAHDGRGHEINWLAWTDDPRFRLHVELSIAVNSRTAGAPRWQAVRVDKPAFVRWLATVKQLVEPLHDPSVEDKLREFLRRHVALAPRTPRKTKSYYLAAAKAELPAVTKRMFERVWPEETPSGWHRPGAPKGRKSSRAR